MVFLLIAREREDVEVISEEEDAGATSAEDDFIASDKETEESGEEKEEEEEEEEEEEVEDSQEMDFQDSQELIPSTSTKSRPIRAARRKQQRSSKKDEEDSDSDSPCLEPIAPPPTYIPTQRELHEDSLRREREEKRKARLSAKKVAEEKKKKKSPLTEHQKRQLVAPKVVYSKARDARDKANKKTPTKRVAKPSPSPPLRTSKRKKKSNVLYEEKVLPVTDLAAKKADIPEEQYHLGKRIKCCIQISYL